MLESEYGELDANGNTLKKVSAWKRSERANQIKEDVRVKGMGEVS